MARPSLDDYVDVAERIARFKQVHPDGSLQTIDWEVRDVAGKTFIVYRAAAFRTADDSRPGHGIAWEPFPGPTPYTRDSELMNAETAAWGRAIVALGLAANRKIASRQEVRARTDEPVAAAHKAQPITTATLADLRKAYGKHRPTDADFRAKLAQVGVVDAAEGDVSMLMAQLTEDQATWLYLALTKDSKVPADYA